MRCLCAKTKRYVQVKLIWNYAIDSTQNFFEQPMKFPLLEQNKKKTKYTHTHNKMIKYIMGDGWLSHWICVWKVYSLQ